MSISFWPKPAKSIFVQHLPIPHLPLAEHHLSIRSPVSSLLLGENLTDSLDYMGLSAKWPIAPPNSPLIIYAYHSLSSSPQIAKLPESKKAAIFEEYSWYQAHTVMSGSFPLSASVFSKANDVKTSILPASLGWWQDKRIHLRESC